MITSLLASLLHRLTSEPLERARLPAKRAIVAGITALFIASCAGGVGDLVSGVGSGGSGIAEGTITGFGSVLVDDLRYDDSRAELKTEGPEGSRPVSSLKLGQRVRVVSSQAGVADSIEVLADLIGPIEGPIQSVAGGKWLRVLGQWVKVDDSSATADVAPTVIDYEADSCGNNCQLTAGKWVEIHGSWVYDSSKSAHILRASRIEYIAPRATVLVSGIAQQAGASIRINSALGTEVVLAGDLAAAEPNQLVRVWAPSGNATAQRVDAVRALAAALPSTVDAVPAVIGGAIDAVDSRSVVIQGTRITIPEGFNGVLPQAGQTVRAALEKAPAGGWQFKSSPAAPEGSVRGVVRIETEIRGGDVARLMAGDKLRGTAMAPVAIERLSQGGCTGLGAEAKLLVTVTARRGPLPLEVDSINCQRR